VLAGFIVSIRSAQRRLEIETDRGA